MRIELPYVQRSDDDLEVKRKSRAKTVVGQEPLGFDPKADTSKAGSRSERLSAVRDLVILYEE